MPGLLFVSQVALETWVEQRKIEFNGNLMTLVVGEGRGRSYALDPAVLFLKVVNAAHDPNHLIAKVKSEAKLRELGAERLEDSVVLGDVAYEVQPGFLAEGAPAQAASTPQAMAEEGAPGLEASGAPSVPQAGEPARSGTLPRDLEEKRKEAEALARFLLENLS
jgi:hypothetical protein